MKGFVVAAWLLVVGTAVASDQTWTNDRNDLGITNYVEEVETPQDIVDYLGLPYVVHRRRDAETINIGEIINIAEKIWKIIEKNKPVVNVKYSYANAVPKGIKSTEELENFSSVQHRSFRMYGKNGFGSTVYDLTYTLVHRYGGTYDGRGQYLDAVTVLPAKLNVLWGYTVDFVVDRVSTVNLGSKEAPVASILMGLSFNVSTVLKTSQFRNLFEFRGDSKDVRSLPN